MQWLRTAVSAGGALRSTPATPRILVMAGLLVLGLSDMNAAQQIGLATQPGPYYVGEPVVVQVIARGFDSGVQPQCRWRGNPPAGIQVQGPQVGQSSRSFVQIINGKMTRTESIDYRFSFLVTAEREGEFAIGPFEVSYDGKSELVEGDRMRFGRLEDDPDMHIELSLARKVVYVGQEIPVQIRWTFAGEIEAVQYAFAQLQIRSPLFDQFTVEQPSRSGRTTLRIATAKGRLEVDAKATQKREEGRNVVEVTGSLVLRADAPGRYDSIPITCRTEKVTRWGRDLFGDAVPRDTVPARAAGAPLSFVVKPIPVAGRPESFAGAVGKGFSINVAADRSVVRIGDPIALTISVAGDGNLESVSLPPLTASAGFDAGRMEVPSEEVAGTLEGQVKRFTINVRVRDQQVQQIPPIAFSWFDPWQEKFLTTRSKPIALQVQDTQVVTAKDVMSASPRKNRSAPPAADTPADGVQPAQPSSGGQLALVGANLAIQRDPGRLLAHRTSNLSPRALAGGVYAVSLFILLAGVMLRRRSQRDMESVRRKKRLKSLRREIARAASLPEREAASQVANAIRALIAEFESADRGQADAIIAVCDNVVYSVGEPGHAGVPRAVEQGIALVDQVARNCLGGRSL